MSNSSSRVGSPWRIAFRKFFSKPLSMVSTIFVGVVVLIATLGYLITPDSSPWANNQHLELSAKPLGFRCNFFALPYTNVDRSKGFFSQLVNGKAKEVSEIPMNGFRVDGLHVVVTPFFEAGDSVYSELRFSIAELLFPNAPSSSIKQSGGKVLLTHDNVAIEYTAHELEQLVREKHTTVRTYWLGTDRFGRDMLSRLIIGARVSLSVGFIAVAISLLIGVFLGATAGFIRGWYDDVVMWFINVVWSVPTLLMVIALTMVIGKGFWQIFVAVGLTMWVEVARVVRGQVMSLREKEFVESAVVAGFGRLRIIFRHILPNVLGPVAIIAAGNFATAMLLEAGLSFLGVGVQPPIPSWGTMIKDHYGYLIMDRAFLAIVPGVAIMLLVLAFTLIGNGLRDALDTKE